MANRIKSQLRAEDTVSRMGGDEFAILLGDITTLRQGEKMLERLHNALAQAFLIEGHEIIISASSGMTLYLRDSADLDTLLRHADQAIYKAKLVGRNQYQLFDFKEDQQLVNKQQQLQEIQDALLQGEMQLYYQPKVNMKTGKVFGVEALIRWIHPNKGLIPPLDFLPLIEGTALEIQLGEWVIKTALQQLEYWQFQGVNLEVSVNISPYHIQSVGFIADLTAFLANHKKIDSKYLQLEILENSALGDLDLVNNIIRESRDLLGVHVALDDFGTGYSSLTHLRNLSANTLKVDQSFVKVMLDDANDYVIVDGIIKLATAFNRKIIAEGVESVEHGIMLLIMGCEQAQGYVIAKPMPANEVGNWLKTYIPNPQWIYYGALQGESIENRLKLFQLCLERWYQLFLSNIKLEPNDTHDWPEMNQKKCHHIIRFKQVLQEQLISSALLGEVRENYESFQQITDDIFNKYNAGQFASAIERLNELQQQYLLICTLLDKEVQDHIVVT